MNRTTVIIVGAVCCAAVGCVGVNDQERPNDSAEQTLQNVCSEGYYRCVRCKGTALVDGRNLDAQLCVRYRGSGEWQVFVEFGAKVFSEPPKIAMCRCGENRRHYEAWGCSPSSDSIFYTGKVGDLISEMRRCSHFEMFVKAANGQDCSASFDGVGEKVEELIKYFHARQMK